jgi:hypothetical protein
MTASSLSPDHEKIAWAWLDNLVDRAQRALRSPQQTGTTPADLPPAVKMTPKARENSIQDAYDSILKKLKADVKSEIGMVQRMEQQLARGAGIDPLYLNYFIVNGKNWPPMDSKTNQALRAIQNIYLWYGAVPRHWNNMVIPDMAQGRNRDRALQDLGKWFLRSVIPKIERKYIREVYKQSQDLVKQFRGGNAPRDPKAAIMLMRDFEKRLVADRFQLKPAIQEVVDLFS